MSSRGTPLTLLTIDIEDCYFFPSNIHNPVKPLDQHLLLAFIRFSSPCRESYSDDKIVHLAWVRPSSHSPKI
jgi:hypothetical protein